MAEKHPRERTHGMFHETMRYGLCVLAALTTIAKRASTVAKIAEEVVGRHEEDGPFRGLVFPGRSRRIVEIQWSYAETQRGGCRVRNRCPQRTLDGHPVAEWRVPGVRSCSETQIW